MVKADVGLKQKGSTEQTLIGEFVALQEGQWVVIGVDLQRLTTGLQVALRLLDGLDDGQKLLLDGAVVDLLRVELGRVVCDGM